MANDYLVCYPSGTRFRVRGVLAIFQTDDDFGAVPIVERGEEVMVLDPRAIIRDDATGKPLYHPATAEGLAPWAREWLAEHCAWGATK